MALVLQCLAHPAMEVGAYTLPFWYDLAKAFERCVLVKRRREGEMCWWDG